ncbi:MAG: UbiA family prenyltransferase, partial [Candidatus Thorarchaeota archaeon]
LYSPQTWFYLLLGVISVSLLNSAVFLINQVTDVDTDQLHSEKARLPISAGNISKYNAIFLVFLFISVGFVFSLFLGLTFILLMFGIFGFGILYSIRPFRIKSRPILDLFIIGLAFGLWAVLTAFTILVANPTISVNPELPLPLLIGPLLFYAGTHCIHTISDYQADKQAGINTTAVHLGPKKTAQLGILLIAIGFLSLYSGVGFYTHLFWYGLLKYKSIFLLIFCGLLFFALFQQFWTWQQAKKPDNSIVIQLQKSGRSVTYLLFFILVVYLLLNVFLFYPIYYPNYTFPWG